MEASPAQMRAPDHFGFVAEEIGKVRIGARTLPLAEGSSNDDLPLAFTNNVRVLEVAVGAN